MARPPWELGDRLAVPVYRSIPGSLFQALAYQSVREGVLRPVTSLVTLVSLTILTLLLARPLILLEWRGGLLLVGSTGILLFAVSVPAYTEFRLVISMAPVFALLASIYCFTLFSKLDQQSLRLVLQRLAFLRTDALMANIVRNSIEGIVTVNAEGAIRDMNPAACSMFGLSQADASNRKFETLVPVMRHEQQLCGTLDSTNRSSCYPGDQCRAS